MRNVALGSLFTLILSIGMFVSQVEAKNGNQDDKNKNEYKYIETKNDRQADKDKNKYEYKEYKYNNGTRNVPIPGTLLFLGGGFAGLLAWRARQPRA